MGSGYITDTEKKAAFAPSPGFPGYTPDVPSGGGGIGSGASIGWGSSISRPSPTASPGWKMPPLGLPGALLRAAQELQQALDEKAAAEPGNDPAGNMRTVGGFNAPAGFSLDGCACGGMVNGYRIGQFGSFVCTTNVIGYPQFGGWNPGVGPGQLSVGNKISTWRYHSHFSGNFANWYRVCQYTKIGDPAVMPGVQGTTGPYAPGANWPTGYTPFFGRWQPMPSVIETFPEFGINDELVPLGAPGPLPGNLPVRFAPFQPNFAPDGTPTRWNDTPIERPWNPPPQRWPGSDHPWRVPHPGSWPGTDRPTQTGPWPGFGRPTRPSQWPSRTVTLTINGGKFTITGRPTVHTRNHDPKKGPKMMIGPIIAAIARKTGFAAATEGCDTIENAYDALPRKYKRRAWKGSGPTPRGWKKRKISCTAQARQVGKYLSEINGMQSKSKQTVIDEFVKNFVRSQAMDWAIGKAARGAAKGLNKMGYRGSSTFGTGPGATGQGYGAGD